jgi:HK97 family phage major capsid protein
MDNTVKHLYARFIELAERSEQETKRYGAPTGETQMALDTLNGIFTATDTMAAQEQRRHNAFLRTLRDGYSSQDARLVTLMIDHDSAWKTTPLNADVSASESKAMTQAGDTTGGFLASESFATNLLHALKEVSPVRQVGTVHLSGGAGEYLPIINDVQAAVRVSESATRTPSADADLDLKVASSRWPASRYTRRWHSLPSHANW